MCMYMYIYIYIYVLLLCICVIHICIYIYRERERDLFIMRAAALYPVKGLPRYLMASVGNTSCLSYDYYYG